MKFILLSLLLLASCYQDKNLAPFSDKDGKVESIISFNPGPIDEPDTPALPSESVYKKLKLNQLFNIYFSNFVIIESQNPFDTKIDYDSIYNLKNKRSPGYVKLVKSIREKINQYNVTQVNDQELLAFYINVYNFSAIDLIVNFYMKNGKKISSITDLSVGNKFQVFKQKFININNRLYSLDDIEKEEISNITADQDARLHFAVICASEGCPVTLNESFKGSKLDEQLDFVTKAGLKLERFIKHDLKRKRSYLSSIFNWYEQHFIDDPAGGIREFIKKYSSHKLQRNYRNFMDYDWSLNKIKNTRNISLPDLDNNRSE